MCLGCQNNPYGCEEHTDLSIQTLVVIKNKVYRAVQYNQGSVNKEWYIYHEVQSVAYLNVPT